MKPSLFALPAVAALFGCASQSSYVHSDATLGRVVVYRNGIAYFERTAHIDGDSLRLAVPADKVDDFLKSLTVVDAKTGKPAPISFPTEASHDKGKDGLIDMNIGLQGKGAHDLRLSYVTEAPSWKPSYRVVVAKNGKVSVQGWAIVDNTSGEDWQNVQLGVGSSSALSFRFDLRSIRVVQREVLHADGLFALAPPTGGATNEDRHGGKDGKVIAAFNDDALGHLENATGDFDREARVDLKKRAMRGAVSGAGAAAGQKVPAGKPAEEPPRDASRAETVARGGNRADLAEVAANHRRTVNTLVVEGFADGKDEDKNAASLARANRAREELLKNGADPARVVAVGRGQVAGRSGGVAVVEAPMQAYGGEAKQEAQGQAQGGSGEPIGTSHFESKSRMSVPRGTSAMVSILSADTQGEVVYFFDPDGARGNTSFPFKAIRLVNPTDSVLESGPVTVFGDGKFVGEGLADPIPAHATAFVPFALDRQIAVEKKEAEDDKISKILTVQRGVFSTEVQHAKRTTFLLRNRLDERVTVYVRHTVPEGYKLAKPANAERFGNAYLLPVVIAPHDKAEVVIEDETPIFRTADIRAPGGMELVSVYLSSAVVEGPLKTKVSELLGLQKDMGNVEQQIGTMRDAMVEYRARMDELHAQIVTLRAVRTAGPLIQNLEKKLTEVSDRLSKATIDLVALQQKLMVSRIRFQDGVAELRLEKLDAAASPAKAAQRD